MAKSNFSKPRRAADPDAPSLLKEKESQLPFGKLNYILMGVCLLFIIGGFLLMSGPGSSVEGGFNPDIFSTRRIVVGPAFCFLGFLLMAFAIIAPARRPRRGTEEATEKQTETQA